MFVFKYGTEKTHKIVIVDTFIKKSVKKYTTYIQNFFDNEMIRLIESAGLGVMRSIDELF